MWREQCLGIYVTYGSVQLIGHGWPVISQSTWDIQLQESQMCSQNEVFSVGDGNPKQASNHTAKDLQEKHTEMSG